MLTLKAPIQLHTGQTLTTSCEAFGERIMGNYNILNMRITPKELLLLLTAPPEALEEQQGMTTLVNHDTRVDMSNITVDVVNNVNNRILLDGSTSFTYQDQVYITSVLNRLGINNVEEFMTQVRQLRIETENTNHMTRLYRGELERILRYHSENESIVQAPVPASAEESGEVVTDPRVDMSIEILNRLGASELYETIHRFQQNVSRAENSIQHNELRLAEHLRLSNELSLVEIKQQLFEQPHIDLTHHVNHFELGTILEAPDSEEAVLSQAAVAALVSAVDNTVTTILNRPKIRQEQWIRLENAVWQTATNAVSRFESYHNYHEIPPAVTQLSVENAWNRYAADMRQYMALRQYQSNRIDQYLSKNEYASENTVLTHLARVDEENEYLFPERTDIRVDRDRLRTTIRELVTSQVVGGRDSRFISREKEFLRHREVLSVEDQHGDRQSAIQDPAAAWSPGERPEVTLPVVSRSSVPAPEPAMPPLELTAREAEEQAPEILVEQIQKIDQNNRTVLQQIQNTVQLQKMQTPPVPAPDMKRTMRDSLRALQEPELVLREIYEEGARQREQRSPYTAHEEAILRQASPADRALYERVLAYQKDPGGALAKGLVTPGSPGVLEAQIRQMEADRTQELTHRDTVREAQEVYENTETVLDRVLHHSTRGTRVEEHYTSPGAVRIVHKQAAPDISEEVLQRLEQRNTSEIVKTETNESVTRHNTSHTEISNEEHKVVQRTTEDITELVNRTLAKQMRTISDQVYRQMEKRLQTERSRRGRF